MENTITRKSSMIMKNFFCNSAKCLKSFFSIQPATTYHISEESLVKLYL